MKINLVVSVAKYVPPECWFILQLLIDSDVDLVLDGSGTESYKVYKKIKSC